jgi:hypothetical protein
MRSSWIIGAMAWAVASSLIGGLPARAEEIEPEYQEVIEKGLQYLIRNQHKDGHWDANGQYPLTMTGLSGMALLMEGSTIREGKYAENIRKAVDWLIAPGRPQPSGLLCNMNLPGEAGRYMYGHGFAMMFLACVYGEEEDAERRRRLEEVLVKAVKFSFDAQTSRGGWGYVSAKDGGNFDEGSVTVTQLQAIRACRNAGIAVPKDCIDKGVKYLHDCTNSQGGVIYSLGGGGGGDGRPALTAAAICCGFSTGQYDSPDVKKWIKFCQNQAGLGAGGGGGGFRFGHDEYTHYYYSQCVYNLGEEGYERLFPNCKENDKLTWKKYRGPTFKNLKSTQQGDGSWMGAQVGPVFATACHLAIMQLDKATLPLYQR